MTTTFAAPGHAPSVSSEPVITADGLTKRYGDVLAVDQLSFEIHPGAVTGFLGPNGSGKTTTFLMLLGLAAPTAGTAHIFGVAYDQLVDPISQVGVLIDSSGFHPDRSALDHPQKPHRSGRCAASIPTTRRGAAR